jgi:AraC-like DNA-binding protein
MARAAVARRTAQALRCGVVADEFGAWSYIHARPEHLAGLVDHVWMFDGTMTCLRERTFPNGLFEIIVHLGPRYSVVEPASRWLCPTSCLTGLQLRHLIVEAPAARTKVLGIRLTPAGAYAVLGRPMHDLAGLTVDLESVAGSAADELVTRCHEAPNGEGCVAAAVDWVDGRLARASRLDAAIAWMLGEIRQRRGAVSIRELQERSGWSKTRLVSTFSEQVGVSPKQYARVMRFSRALTQIHRASATLSEVAAEAGYYDQPHMNSEFKELSGFTPREFLSSHRFPNTVSVADV